MTLTQDQIREASAFKAVGTAVYDSNNKQICLVYPSNCSKKKAMELAKWLAEKLNSELPKVGQ